MSDVGGPTLRLRDFPAVFLSYDEPCADRNWLDLKRHLPSVTRVHGVKGLDACHKAAAAAVPGDWVVTVDADTRISPTLADAVVPEYLLTGNFRLDWLARNSVNGLWSGNGCVKLWPKALIEEMRTHEAAPDGTLSLDHDVAKIRSGKSTQAVMPERAAMTDPAATAFHGFRAGLRETVFLRIMADEAAVRRGGQGWQTEAGLARLIEIWCSVGRHTPNGRWVLYGARFGLLIRDIWPEWDLHQINDHDAIRHFWTSHIRPRFQRGSARRPDEISWNWQALEADLARLAAGLSARGGPALAEFGSPKSGALAASSSMASPVRPARLDALGYLMLTSAKGEQDIQAARVPLEAAAAQDHPAAHLNLGVLLRRQKMPERARAAWHFAAAARLGNEFARNRLETLAKEEDAHAPDGPNVLAAADLPLVIADAGAAILKARFRELQDPLCLVVDNGVSLLSQAALHVPDALLVGKVSVLGYLSLCQVTGLPRPWGVRVAAPTLLAMSPKRQADVVFPLVLGLLPPPADREGALRGGILDAGRDIPPLLATLGRDVPFGDHWILGSLLARLGQPPSLAERRRIAATAADGLAAEIEALAQQLSLQTGHAVPVWTADESQALKRMLSAVPSRAIWLAGAKALSGLGADFAARSQALGATATAVWGKDPYEP